MVCEWIRGALSLCLTQKKNDFVLLAQCSNSASDSSWWKTLGFHAVKPEWIYYADSRNFPCIPILATFDTTNSLLLTYAQGKLSMANDTCMTF